MLICVTGFQIAAVRYSNGANTNILVTNYCMWLSLAGPNEYRQFDEAIRVHHLGARPTDVLVLDRRQTHRNGV